MYAWLTRSREQKITKYNSGLLIDRGSLKKAYRSCQTLCILGVQNISVVAVNDYFVCACKMLAAIVQEAVTKHVTDRIVLLKDKFDGESTSVLFWLLVYGNPNITWDMVQNNPDKPWSLERLRLNPNRTWDIVSDNHDSPW